MGVLFVISAPSGAGKSTLIEKATARFPDLIYSVSCTTRAPRAGERNGIDYHFKTEDEFREMIDSNGFLEWKKVHGNLYGTPAEPVHDAIRSGNRMILDIDVQGAKEVFDKIERAVGVFIAPPGLDELEKRLRERNTDSEETIKARLENAKTEMESAPLFDHLIINDDLDRAADELADVIEMESGRK
jgi:guanylate kinase